MRHVLMLIVAAGCYVQPAGTHYALDPGEQCAQSALVPANGGLYGTSSTVAPGSNGGLYGASQRDAPGSNGGLYGATSTAAPGDQGGLYGAAMRNSASPDLQCRRPSSPAEQCEIRSLQASAQLKHQSNVGEVPPVSSDQVEYARSSSYQNCMSGPPGSAPPPPQ